MKRTFVICVIGILLCGVTQSSVSAQVVITSDGRDDPVDLNVPRTYQLTVDPATSPVPALKVELQPVLRQRRPGNAVPYYYRAILITQSLRDAYKQYAENEKVWLEKPLNEVPVDAMQSWLAMHAGALGELKEATRREYCEWDLRPQDLKGMKTVEFLLPEFQDARQLARVLRVKCRLELSQGNIQDAIETLQTGYQFAHDIGKAPFLVSSLVGIAICQNMNESLLEVIAAKDSPNLYWALTALPRPLVDMRSGMDTERRLPGQIFPWLSDVETATRSPDEWQRVFQEAIATLKTLDSSSTDQWENWLATTALALKAYPVAKQELIAAGFDAKRVEEMPVGQVLAIQASRSVNYSYDELFKLVNLPYPEFLEGAKEVQNRLQREGHMSRMGTRLSIASVLLPGLIPAMSAGVRMQRDMDAIRVIEAVRMHAAVSKGMPPPSLADLKVVPIPANPIDGTQFSYKLEGSGAVLDVAPMPDQKPAHSGKRFIIQFRK